MTDRPHHAKWVGLFVGLVLNGSAHFLCGNRAAGFKWYFGIVACSLVPAIVIAIPGMMAYVLGLGIGLFSIVLWMVMLKQSYRVIPRMNFIKWLALAAISVGMHFVWISAIHAVVHTFHIPTGAMSPTVRPGHHLFVERLSYHFREPRRGDIIVFRTEGIQGLPVNACYIKRLAGVPGDRIRINPPNVIVNGDALVRPPIFKKIASTVPPFEGYQLASAGARIDAVLVKPSDEIHLRADEYFVLGDNTHSSLDSRYWGPVSRGNIIGKATRIYWPLSRVQQSLGNE